MSKPEMRRLRVAATKAKFDLNDKVIAAAGAGSPNLSKLQKALDDAVLLEAEASTKEIAAILNATSAAAPAKLTTAANTLEAEVARLKASTAHLKELGDALKAGKAAVGLFNAANG